MPYAEQRRYAEERVVRVVHATGGVWSIEDGRVRASTNPGTTAAQARSAADRIAGSVPLDRWRPLAALLADGDCAPCLVDGCAGTMLFRVQPGGVHHGACDLEFTHVVTVFPEDFAAGVDGSALVRKVINALPRAAGRPVHRGIEALPAGVHRLWRVRTTDRECIGAIVVGASAIEQLSRGIDFPRTAVAVAWIRTARLGRPFSRPGLDGVSVIVQDVLEDGGESSGMPCSSETDALEVLDEHRARLLSSGWFEVPLEPELDPD